MNAESKQFRIDPIEELSNSAESDVFPVVSPFARPTETRSDLSMGEVHVPLREVV
jgi:hypothetical protein